MLNVSDTEKRGCTIARTIMHLWFWPSSPGGANGIMLVDLGLSVVSDDALTAAAVPEADTSGDFPLTGWLYRDEIAIIDSIDSNDNSPVELFKDLRTQRKMDRAALVLHVEGNSGTGTAFNVQVRGLVRTLYRLP